MGIEAINMNRARRSTVRIRSRSNTGEASGGRHLVELADIAFSIHSILAAVAMADELPDRLGTSWKLAVVYIGGILGILTMRFVAGYFIILLDRFRGLANGAYIMVAWIGIKLMSGGLYDRHFIPEEMSATLFWSVMLLIAAGSLLVNPRPAVKEPTADVTQG